MSDLENDSEIRPGEIGDIELSEAQIVIMEAFPDADILCATDLDYCALSAHSHNSAS